MMAEFLKALSRADAGERVIDPEYESFRKELHLAGLNEEMLRRMDPEDRVAALEHVQLAPYNYIFLAC